MAGIQDVIQQQLTPNVIEQISQAIDADPGTTRQAVDAAVPMLMGGMAAHASSPGGAETIDAAATEHAVSLDSLGGILENSGGLGNVLGGLGGILSGSAGGVLGNILGSNHADVQDGVTQASGLDRAKAGHLLMILAPIVLGAIARHRSQTGASPTQVSSDLQHEAQRHASHPQFGGIIGGILNRATGQS